MKTKANETWKGIKGMEDKYEVSNLGRVRNLNWRNKGIVALVNPIINHRTGYVQVPLNYDGKPTMKYLHRLVA